MANRFLETNYYKSPFVRRLKGSLKCLYSFIICDCTASGIWAFDLESASLYTGFTVTMEEFEENFVKRKKAIDLGNGKYFFPDFIEHQYPKGLQMSNKAHTTIIFELRKLQLIDNECKIIKEPFKGSQDAPLEEPFKDSLKGTQGIGNGNGNGQGNGNGNGRNLIAPEMFKIFKKQHEKYPFDQEKDYSGCYQIAVKIANDKNWKPDSVLQEKKTEVLSIWSKIVLFTATDNWFSKRSITDLANEWQRLMQAMNAKPPTNAKPEVVKKPTDYSKY